MLPNISVSYPCEFGFEYLVAGAAVWIVFLPFYVCTLLGNCWRQCCCCLCDPLVSFTDLSDHIQSVFLHSVHFDKHSISFHHIKFKKYPHSFIYIISKIGK